MDKQKLRCPCCGTYGIADESLRKLEHAEQLAGICFDIKEGYRCFAYNAALNKSPTSSHLVGNAFNINCFFVDSSGKKLFDKRKAFLIIKSCLQAGFTRIGINEHQFYIHVDDDCQKRQNLFFAYPREVDVDTDEL